MSAEDDAVTRHWRWCHTCQEQLRTGGPLWVCEDYERIHAREQKTQEATA